VIHPEVRVTIDEWTYHYKPTVNLSEVASLLHRDDPKVVLLVQPYKEVLFGIMEDTTALWPVSVYTSCFIEPEWTKTH
jgi:hypothetical protein